VTLIRPVHHQLAQRLEVLDGFEIEVLRMSITLHSEGVSTVAFVCCDAWLHCLHTLTVL
jgi:hypothetical protein